MLWFIEVYHHFVQQVKRNGRTTSCQDQASHKVNLSSLGFSPSLYGQHTYRDLDQVHADIFSAEHLAQHLDSKAVEDLPGLGKFYCIQCAKWFEGEHSLVQHRRGKNHKRRLEDSFLSPKKKVD